MPKNVRRCLKCDRPYEGDGFCPECERDINTPLYIPERREVPWVDHPPIVGPGLHVAGPVVGLDQCCAKCGALLATQRVAGIDPVLVDGDVPFTQYPQGSIVERGRSWQAMNLLADEPTCEAA